MARDDLLERIDKLMALAGDNPNEHEAQAAALAAQRLMAQYSAERAKRRAARKKDEAADWSELWSDRSSLCERIVRRACTANTSGKAWGVHLALCVADSFRCCVYIHTVRHGRSIVFVGYETDACVAAKTFDHLFRIGERLAGAECRRAKRDFGTAVGVKNTFLIGRGDGGFVGGIRSVLEAQTEELLLTCPREVKRYFARISRDFEWVRSGAKLKAYDPFIDARGFDAGRVGVWGGRPSCSTTRPEHPSAPAALPAGRG